MDNFTYKKLLEAHRHRIFSYAWYCLRDQDDAEDVTQEVFLRLWKNGGDFEVSKAEGWLVRVAHNLCIDQARRRKTVRTYLGQPDARAMDQIPEPADSWTNPENGLQRSRVREEILTAMDTLQEETQSIMMMHYWQGLRLQDIAQILGKKTSTVKVQIHRGRKALRLVLEAGTEIFTGLETGDWLMGNYKDTNLSRHDECTGIEILLTEFCAGDLDPAEAALVEKHLDHCPSCRAEFSREEFLRGTLSALPLVACPERVTENLLTAIGDDQGSPSSRKRVPALSRRWTTFVGLTAAAAAAVLILANPLGSDRISPPLADLAVEVAESPWTQAEISAARQDLKFGLLLTARIIDRTERSTVKEVFGRHLPGTLSRSLKSLMTTSEGGQG